jgi:hypothetical protein
VGAYKEVIAELRADLLNISLIPVTVAGTLPSMDGLILVEY